MTVDTSVCWYCAQVVTLGVLVVVAANAIGGLLSASIPVFGIVLHFLLLVVGLLLGSYVAMEALWALVAAASAAGRRERPAD